MPFIELEKNVPGIRSLALYSPQTGKPLYELAQVLLRGESPLPAAERELIAAFVSSLNQCQFCSMSHAAASRCLYGHDASVVDNVLSDFTTAPITPKLRSLLTIAQKVQQDARTVSDTDVELARSLGAVDRDIHDTVLIAATFCMFNRYVDGLATLTPTDENEYKAMGERLAAHGYTSPVKPASVTT